MGFETARLTVRGMGPADAAFMLALLDDPGFRANIGDRGVRTIDQAERYIAERGAAGEAADAIGMRLVARRSDGVGIGTVGFVRRKGLDHPDLGFAFFAHACGQGYGSEAARGLLDHAPALRPLLAITAVGNAASQRVLAKLGFAEAGTVTLPSYGGTSRLFRLER